MGERVGGDRHLRHRHERRLFLRHVRGEVGRKLLLVYPPVAGAVRLERLGRLRQTLFDRRATLPFIQRKRGNIDQRRNLWMIAGLGDDGPAIGVAHQNHRPVHGVDRRLREFLVVGVGCLGVLHHRDLVTIPHEDGCDGFPTGAVRERSVHQDHVLNTLCHAVLPVYRGSLVPRGL